MLTHEQLILQTPLVREPVIEAEVGIDEERLMATQQLLGTYYPVLRKMRGWLLSHVDFPEESRIVLDTFNQQFGPVTEAIRSCGPTQGNILELTFLEHRDQVEIGKQLGLQPADVQRNLFNALKQLTEHPNIQNIID